MRVRSLTARVLIIASAWIAVALIVIAVVISQLYRNGSERGFTDVLRAQLYNVINSVSVGKDGQLEGRPTLGDLRFVQPQTGWYWIVEPLDDFDADPISSISLGAESVPVADIEAHPFDSHYERFYRARDSAGNAVLVAETEVLLDAEGHAARFRVIGNRNAVEDDIAAFNWQIFLVFSIFGIGSLIVNVGAILFGLRPLDVVRRSLERIRAGESEALTAEIPREIEPLASEMNALIESNRRVVERARTQVGNLAHSLKTPVAVLLNESRTQDAVPAVLVAAQVETMRSQIDTYLDRARIAAQQNSVLARTDAAGVVERVIRVMGRLSPDLSFSFEKDGEHMVLAMEQQDVEEITGNLLDNAAKFAAGRVKTTIAPAPSQPGEANGVRRSWLRIVIEDDGPGLSESEIAEAVKRGRRLDESKPGTGLGLSIVGEIVREYQGSLTLDRSALGGLRAVLVLPSVAAKPGGRSGSLARDH